jgi:NAD(P)-dependent dehydrogenase (short-subunit alcohol dehydrogenase family)
MSQAKPLCAVVGVGPGNGAAFARRFAAEGYAVALLARGRAFAGELGATLPDARAYECDVADDASVASAFTAIRAQQGDPDVVIYNAGSGTFGTFDEVSISDFDSALRVNAHGAFTVAKQVTPAMQRNGGGAIIFIGATASVRGGVRSAGFAAGKAAQRSLAQSMARHLWPAGIHVALIVVDGVVDLPRTRQRMPDKPDDFFIAPDGVANIAWQLVQQPRSAWSFEVEARPYRESW